MATVNLEYNTLDETVELVPEYYPAGLTSGARRDPFDLQEVTGLMFGGRRFEAAAGFTDYRHGVDSMVGVLYMTLAWFRRLEISADELQRRVKDYPDRFRHGPRHAVLSNPDVLQSMDVDTAASDPQNIWP